MNQQSESASKNEVDLLSARQAAALLGVKPATLYAYVSRGLLHSVPTGKGHVSRYHRAEVLRLKARAEARSGHGPVAASALDFGEPVLESALTKIDAAGQRYRGYSAIELCRDDTPFESVAELLWCGNLPETPPRFSAKLPLPASSFLRLIPEGTAPLFTLALLMPALALRDEGRFAAPLEMEKERARRILSQLAEGLALVGHSESDGAAEQSRLRLSREQDSYAAAVLVALQKPLIRPPRASVRAINHALILMADHELNQSTFAARIAASAGADLYSCLSAALATVSGPRHGGACDRVEALVVEAERAGDAHKVVRERLRRGETVPGFGQPLYPAGDPRTPPMLELSRELTGQRARLRVLFDIIAAMREAGHPPPAVDCALVALTLALGLPAGSASCLFAVGRSAGWVAHVLEQRQNPVGLRPRARYNGPEARATR